MNTSEPDNLVTPVKQPTPKFKNTPTEELLGTVATHKKKERPNKYELAMLLAIWAESKPDCGERNLDIVKMNNVKMNKDKKDKMKEKTSMDPSKPTGKQKYVWASCAGACVIDKNDKIVSVEGSGYTHAATALCSRLGASVMEGSVVCISRMPCTMCVKLLLQAKVQRIIIPEIKQDNLKPVEPDRSESPDQPINLEDDIVKAIRVTNTALSTIKLPDYEYKKLEEMQSMLDKDSQFKNHEWAMCCTILASYRSQEAVRVGAVLAEHIDDKRLVIHGVSYNGTIQKALDLDFPLEAKDKGKYSLHAEQNLFMHSTPADKTKCTLYTNYSPCDQCCGLIKEMNVPNTYYAIKYREHFDLDHLFKADGDDKKQGILKQMGKYKYLFKGLPIMEILDQIEHGYIKDMSKNGVLDLLDKKLEEDGYYLMDKIILVYYKDQYSLQRKIEFEKFNDNQRRGKRSKFLTKEMVLKRVRATHVFSEPKDKQQESKRKRKRRSKRRREQKEEADAQPKRPKKDEKDSSGGKAQ